MQPAIRDVISERSAWAVQDRAAERIRQTMHHHGCLVYGAGGYGQQVVASLRSHGYAVRGYIDGKAKPGQSIGGCPVFQRDAVTRTQAAAAVLVLAINNFRTPVGEVVDWARGMNFADIVFVPELPDLVDPTLGNYWQSSRSLPARQVDAIERLDALLADDRSRTILRQLMRYRITGRPEDHPEVDRDRQYFPEDLPLPTSDIAVVDCGAFPGDLLETATKAGVKLTSWYCFEPDPTNFRQLGRFVQAQQAAVGEAVLFPCGVGGDTGFISFAAGNADASRAVQGIGSGEVEVVPVVRVDDVLKLSRLDMVKLDIEGFEATALDGMAKLLSRHRPRVVVAIYHKPSDLWDLPLKIDAMLPGGRYALRQHGYNGYDTVLYVDWN